VSNQIKVYLSWERFKINSTRRDTSTNTLTETRRSPRRRDPRKDLEGAASESSISRCFYQKERNLRYALNRHIDVGPGHGSLTQTTRRNSGQRRPVEKGKPRGFNDCAVTSTKRWTTAESECDTKAGLEDWEPLLNSESSHGIAWKGGVRRHSCTYREGNGIHQFRYPAFRQKHAGPTRGGLHACRGRVADL